MFVKGAPQGAFRVFVLEYELGSARRRCGAKLFWEGLLLHRRHDGGLEFRDFEGCEFTVEIGLDDDPVIISERERVEHLGRPQLRVALHQLVDRHARAVP